MSKREAAAPPTHKDNVWKSGERGGAPPKLTDERERIILEALEGGNWMPTAARLAGVSASTVRNWVTYGEEDPKKYPRMAQFAAKYRKMMAVAEQQLVAAIRNGAVEDPSYAQWLLEKRFPKRWGSAAKQRIELTGADGGPIKVQEVRQRLDAKLDALAAKLRAKS